MSLRQMLDALQADLSDSAMAGSSVDECLRTLDYAILRRCEWAVGLRDRALDASAAETTAYSQHHSDTA
jgi:hypothetical protein